MAAPTDTFEMEALDFVRLCYGFNKAWRELGSLPLGECWAEVEAAFEVIDAYGGVLPPSIRKQFDSEVWALKDSPHRRNL